MALSLITSGLSFAAGKVHEHGLGRVNLVQDGANYTLEVELPLDTLVGFERPPRTPAERQSAQSAMARLREPTALFRTLPAPGCAVQAAEVEAPVLEGGGPSTNATGAAAAKAVGEHADAKAVYSLQCPATTAPQRLEVLLFDAFPRLKRLDVQTALATGQGRHRLTPSNRVIMLRR